MLIAAKTFNCVIGIESDEFLHSYVHFRQDLVEEKVALSKYTSSDAYLNNIIRRTFL